MVTLLKYNIFDQPLELCSLDPVTGYYREGCCTSSDEDTGMHMVCAEMTIDFLNFSLKKGNDLISAKPAFNFKGLKPGDRWCLCTDRWLEALKARVAPKIFLNATNKEVLRKINIEILKEYALDIN